VKSGQRLMILLGILLPVPLFAATGLTIPLPASVERLAAELVPFADAADLGGSQAAVAGSHGTIVETNEVTQNRADRSARRVEAAPVRKAALHTKAKPPTVRVKKVRNVPPGAAHRRSPKLQPKARSKPEYKAPNVAKPTRPARAGKIR
jgi:hypothetical protein